MKRFLPHALLLLSVASAVPAYAAQREAVYSPKQGVICDKYACADDKGLSKQLTEKYISKKAATKLFGQGEFDTTEFTLSNGVFCDTKERLCRKDRYFEADGKRSAVSDKYTKMLFGK